MMKKLREKKGFTLAELLIVVAIIAILVAVSIPVFTRQLEKSRESTDASNIRGAYARLVIDILEDPANDGLSYEVTMTQTQDGWQNEDVEESFTNIQTAATEISEVSVEMDIANVEAGGTVTLTYAPPADADSTGTISISIA